MSIATWGRQTCPAYLYWCSSSISAQFPSAMLLTCTSNHITDTVFVDDSGRQLYATSTSTFGGKTDVMKLEQMWNKNLATLQFRCLLADTININGQELPAKSYAAKPAWWSRYALTRARRLAITGDAYLHVYSRRVFTCASGSTYEWVPKGSTWKVRGRGSPMSPTCLTPISCACRTVLKSVVHTRVRLG